VSEFPDILAFRAETLVRLAEFQKLGVFGAKTIVDHVVACDSLLLGLKVEAHQSLESDEDAPDRSTNVPSPEVEARLCLTFANFGIVYVAHEALEKYLERIRGLQRTASVPVTPQQMTAWARLVQEVGAALADLRGSRFEDARLVARVTSFWPGLRLAIEEARENYGEVLDPASLNVKLNLIEKFVIAIFIIFLCVLWSIFVRSL
jgi:hypothetical protein